MKTVVYLERGRKTYRMKVELESGRGEKTEHNLSLSI